MVVKAVFRELAYDGDVISSNLMKSFRNPHNYYYQCSALIKNMRTIKWKFYGILFMIHFDMC